MKIIDKGVIDPSYMDFTTSSNFTKKALYSIPQFGHFYCKNGYDITRDCLDMYLLIYVRKGALHLETRAEHYEARENEILLLDCHFPHHYYCTRPAEFIWFHFYGGNSRDYIEHLYEKYGIHYAGTHVKDLKDAFKSVISYAKLNPASEYRIHLHLTQILCVLADPRDQYIVDEIALAPAIQHIAKYFDAPISLDRLAAECSMSTSHFIRSFKKYMDFTPHEYLLFYRLKQSKRLLLTSTKSIEEIAEICGFNSASHFARTFKSKENMTPSRFRNIKF